MHRLRLATLSDVHALQRLIDRSVRALSVGYYTPAQIESALRFVFGPDTQLIADGTYYVAESDTGDLIAAGGWSRRRTLYGGDQMKGADDPLLDPRTEPARIRAFYVDPGRTRRGLGRELLDRSAVAAAAAGFRTLELMSTLPGVPLYRAQGFVEIERLTTVLPDGIELPVIRMRRPIRQPAAGANPLTRLLGIRHPIVQAPIGSATTPELAAAVSNAGGLGSLSLTWRSTGEARAMIRRTKALTHHPFAVNVVLTWPLEARLDRIALALDEDATTVWTFWGDAASCVAAVHAAGGRLLHTVGSIDEALTAARAGVDVLVAQGIEAGGHVRGLHPWRDLLIAVLRDVPGLPVMVAGGLADRHDVAEALAAGAGAACLGTRFVCSREADAADVYQQMIVDAAPGQTILTRLFDKGWPEATHRVLRNSTVRLWEAAGCPPPGQRPGESDRLAVGPDGIAVERYSDTIPTRHMHGELEALALYAGESSARIRDVLPAGEIVRQLVQGL